MKKKIELLLLEYLNVFSFSNLFNILKHIFILKLLTTTRFLITYKSFSQQFQTPKSKWLGFLIAVIQATPTLKKKCFFPGFKWLKSFITRWPEKTFFVELWQSFELALIINLDVLYWFLSRPSTLFPTKQPARGCLKEMDLKI